MIGWWWKSYLKFWHCI